MTQAQDDIEDELRIELMTMRAENFRTQVLREPWKAMALAAAAGAGLMAAAIAALTLLLSAIGG